MWKPSSVVEHHRQRAVFIWIGLIVTIFAYTAWQISVVVEKQKNPSTTISVKNDKYAFPHLSVCLYGGFGCHVTESYTVDDCVETAAEFSDATYEGEVITPTVDEVDPSCVAFDLPQFQVPEGENEGSGIEVQIKMFWITSLDPSEETDYGLDVDIVLEGSGGRREVTRVPYSRNLGSASEDVYDLTALTIGKTHRTFLSREPVTTFPALTVSTTKYFISYEAPATAADWTTLNATSPVTTNSSYTSSGDDDDAEDDGSVGDFAMGALWLNVFQGSYSLNNVDDVQPKVLGTLLGSIGGFWELLLLAWGLFFISAAHGEEKEPELHARDFSATVRKALQKLRSNQSTYQVHADETHGRTTDDNVVVVRPRTDAAG